MCKDIKFRFLLYILDCAFLKNMNIFIACEKSYSDAESRSKKKMKKKRKKAMECAQGPAAVCTRK